jgi:multiple sugar transport system ATP-binding protein
MNFVDARIVRSDGDLLVDAESFTVKFPPEKQTALAEHAGREVVFGIRPEDMFDTGLSPLVAATPDNTVRVGVEVIEPMGAISILYLTAGPHSLIASVDSATQAKESGELDVVFDMQKAHVFDKESEITVC